MNYDILVLRQERRHAILIVESFVYTERVGMAEKRDINEDDDFETTEAQDDEKLDLPNEY